MFNRDSGSMFESEIQTLDRRATKLRDQVSFIQRKLATARADQQSVLVEDDPEDGGNCR